MAAGIDFIDLGKCARRSVAVANFDTAYSTDFADHAMAC
jgi:hydroxypyruvate reductase 2